MSIDIIECPHVVGFWLPPMARTFFSTPQAATRCSTSNLRRSLAVKTAVELLRIICSESSLMFFVGLMLYPHKQ